MLRRLAASLLSLTLLSSVAAAKRPPWPPPDHEMAQFLAAQQRAHARPLVLRALARRRAQNLGRFHAYRTRGVYPHDFVAGTTQNIWRDNEGHLCAAATIIDADGQHALVEQIAAGQTNVRLGEVTDGPLLDWILTSGLTQVEVATIQEPMMGPRKVPKPRDDSWRIAEDARLRRKYARIEQTLRDNRADALEQAADRLLDSKPELAWALIGETAPTGAAAS
jgi:hypothetical protein